MSRRGRHGRHQHPAAGPRPATGAGAADGQYIPQARILPRQPAVRPDPADGAEAPAEAVAEAVASAVAPDPVAASDVEATTAGAEAAVAAVQPSAVEPTVPVAGEPYPEVAAPALPPALRTTAEGRGSAARSETRNDSRAEGRSDARQETRSEARPETRSESRNEARSEPRNEPRNDARQDSRQDQGAADGEGGRASCTTAQLRRFIKSRPWIPMHELRRRFGIYGGDDDVTPVRVGDSTIFIGLPAAEGRLMGDLLSSGDVGYELSLDPITPVVVGVYPMRPVPRG